MTHLVTLYFFLYITIRHASEVGLVVFSILGLIILIVPTMRLRALGAMSGWRTHDSWMSLSMCSVFIFKIISSTWSASPELGLNNAVWHAHFATWPLIVLAFLYCKPKINDALIALSAALSVTGLWTFLTILSGSHGYYQEIFKINPGVLAELVLVCGSLLLVAATTYNQNNRKFDILCFRLGVLGAFVILYSTGRRTEWIGFFVVVCSLTIWHLRHSFNLCRSFFAIVLISIIVFTFFYLRQDRFVLAYREFIQYFDLLGESTIVTASSVGARLEMYRLGLTAFFNNPIFGMGSGVRPYLLQAYGGLNEAQFPHRHFHSEFLQVLVEGGLIWAGVLTAAIVYWLKQAVFNTWSTRPVLALMAAYLSISFLLAGSMSAGLIYGPANATFVMFSALIWVSIRQSDATSGSY
jgi:O-antigen ligase